MEACEFACVFAFARPVEVGAFADALAPFCGAFGFVQPTVGFQPWPPLSDAVFALAATHWPKAAFAFGLGDDAGCTSVLCPFDEPVVTFAVAVEA